MIEINNVTKSFSSSNGNVVENICIQAQPGHIIGLLGANGAGKTTLMRLTSGLLYPDSGNISICGIDVHAETYNARKHLGVMLGGDVSLYNRLTAYENIMYFSELQGVNRQLAQKRISELCGILCMEKFLHRPVTDLSRGMRQKVAFCRTVIHDPDVILLDEPSTGLDIYSIRDVGNFIRQCKNQEKTILLSTHNIHEIESLCDEIIILKNGKVLINKSYNDAMKDTKARNAMEMFFNIEGDYCEKKQIE